MTDTHQNAKSVKGTVTKIVRRKRTPLVETTPEWVEEVGSPVSSTASPPPSPEKVVAPPPYTAASCARELWSNTSLSKAKVELIDIDALNELKTKYKSSLDKRTKQVMEAMKKRLFKGNKLEVHYELPKKISNSDVINNLII